MAGAGSGKNLSKTKRPSILWSLVLGILGGIVFALFTMYVRISAQQCHGPYPSQMVGIALVFETILIFLAGIGLQWFQKKFDGKIFAIISVVLGLVLFGLLSLFYLGCFS